MALERWEIDSGHSGIHFSVRHMVVAKVRGQFSRWSATIVAEDGDLARAQVEAVIDASSIETGIADRDAHLKSPDFLDVANYPELTFKSKRVESLGGGRFLVLGDLTIRGVTREVALDVEHGGRIKDPWGNERAGFMARTSIDRKDFGLRWNQVLEAGGLLVGDRVDIEIDVEAVKQTAAKAA
ncbi:MAG: YceI family protein [Myxococcales bacterium]|nr:YceI family protein [Myxococcota bacterium]MDW8283245.1 YceI family protein [Myxococcales bacterium]